MEFNTLVLKAKELGISEIEVYSVKQSGIDMEFFDGDIDANTTKMTDVMCVRGVYNGQLATVYTEKSDDTSIDFVLNSIIRNATLITKDEPYFIYGGDDVYPVVKDKETDFELASTQDKINLCKKLDELLKSKCAYVYKTETAYSESSYEYSIVNSNGLNVSKTGKNASVFVELIASKDGEVKTAYDFFSITKMAEASYDRELELEEKKYKLQINSLGASDKIIAKNLILVYYKSQRLIKRVYKEVLKDSSFVEFSFFFFLK